MTPPPVRRYNMPRGATTASANTVLNQWITTEQAMTREDLRRALDLLNPNQEG